MSARQGGRPPRTWVCLVATNKEYAAKLLHWIVGIYPHATQRRRGHQGLWNANSRAYICAQAGLTLKQYKLGRPVLIELGWAEFLDGGFAGKRVILTRPTPAFMRLLEGAVTYRRAREILAQRDQSGDQSGNQPGDQSNTLCSPCPSAPSLSAAGGEGEGEKGREGQGQDGAAAPANGCAVETSADRYLRRRSAHRAADAALVEQARAIQANPELTPEAVRAALLRLLPVLTPMAPKVTHPAQYPDARGERWHLHSPENIVMQYRRYATYHGNALTAHGLDVGRRSAPVAPLSDADLGAQGRAYQAALERAKATPLQPWRDDLA